MNKFLALTLAVLAFPALAGAQGAWRPAIGLAAPPPLEALMEPSTLGADALACLSDGVAACRDPAIVASRDRLLATWVAERDGQLLVELAHGGPEGWWPAEVISGEAPGDVAEHAPAFDNDGLAAVAFVRVQPEGSQLVLWREGVGGQVVAASPGRMETPALSFDDQGRPVIAWAESDAGDSRVYSAHRTRAGWSHAELSRPGQSYDILPMAFGGARPLVAWYSLEGEEFALRAVRLLEDGSTRPAVLADRMLAPPGMLPILELAPDGRTFSAVWVEALSDGESVVGLAPSLEGDSVLHTAPRTAPGARQVEPAGLALPGGGMALAWREERRDGARAAVLAGDRFRILEGVVEPTQPRLALGAGGALHLLLVSDARDGGDGQVYAARVD